VSGEEIRKNIISLNESIMDAVNPAVFVLNSKVQEAQKEILRLRGLCNHEYDDLGYCIYCDKRKD